MNTVNYMIRNKCYYTIHNSILCRLCLLFLLLSISTRSYSTNYYVDPSSTSSISNGTLSDPWKTMSQVNAGTTGLIPGDSVLFKRGQTISGRLIVYTSGTVNNPIVYSAYGIGNLPELTYTASDIITITNRQYIVIDGLKIIDKTMSLTDHTITAKISYAITLQNSPHCTIKRCDISLVGIAIAAQAGSNFTTIDANYLHNLRAVRNTVGGDDDYGANAMVIGSSYNTITNNKMEDCWATSYDYGFDGGAVEFFGTEISNNTILYNTAIDCNGFIEIGSSTYGVSSNNLVGYNKIINCGQTGTFHNKINGFAVRIDQLKFYNNVILETKKQFNPIRSLFWYSDPTQIDMVIIKNNIIWLSTGENVISAVQDTSQLIHTNNIYKIRNGIVGYALDSTERYYIDQEKIFNDTTGDAENWDLLPYPNSPAINLGTDVGLYYDIIGQTIIGKPDVGVYEYQFNDTTEPPPIINISIGYSILTSYNTTTNVYVTVTGGTAPYMYQLNNGIFQSSNIFTNLTAGSYLITVKDANGYTSSKTVNLLITSITTDPDKKITLKVAPNPSYSSFTVSTIKYRGSFVTMNLNVYNTFGQIVYSAQGRSNVTYTFGANFIPGNYVLVAVVDGTVQAVKLVKL